MVKPKPKAPSKGRSFNLILTLPDSEPVLYRLEANRIGLGRGVDNQIQVAEKAVSSRHCEFRRTGDSAGIFELEDLGSTNGTKVNGNSIRNGRISLKSGDTILLGESVTAQFIEAIEKVVTERQSRAKTKEKTGQITQVMNPVAAAVARQEKAMRT